MRLTADMTDRAAGVLLASAAGDALGAGYEFTYPDTGTPIDMVGGGPFGFAPGEWTDDTSMTVAVARVTAQGIDLRSAAGLNAVAAGFTQWFASDPKDVGNQTRAVLSAGDSSGAGMQATASRLTGLTGGNGSLMRTAAVGLAYLDNHNACAEAALAVSELTHHDERAGQACQLWSHAIRHAVVHGTFDGVHGYLDIPGVDAAFWRPLLKQAEKGAPQDFPNNGWVVHALQTAWWAITHAQQKSAAHLQEALELAVRAGHDTDTTAAIAGALLGARWGASAVPARWRRVLHGWPGLAAKDLIRLGVLTALGGHGDAIGWPSAGRLNYTGWRTDRPAVRHPHDGGLFLGGYDAAVGGSYDAIVSLCRMGVEPLATAEHVQFWLSDKGPDGNPNLKFVLDDAVQTIKDLRADGKTVLLHCVEGSSRTPSVAARYSVLLGKDPKDVLKAMPWAQPNDDLWKAAVTVRKQPSQTHLCVDRYAGMTSYNGSCAKFRDMVGKHQKKMFDSGRWMRPAFCEMCGKTSGFIAAHTEDYRQPGNWTALCLSCHAILHGRFAHPKTWLGLVQKMDAEKGGHGTRMLKTIFSNTPVPFDTYRSLTPHQ